MHQDKRNESETRENHLFNSDIVYILMSGGHSQQVYFVHGALFSVGKLSEKKRAAKKCAYL